MNRLLIVDDERYIVDGLYELFVELPDMELDIYKAYSGRDAIKILKSIKIDIILTDIHMPGMSGLELAEKVFDNWPGSKVIFLTGYNEFDYAYKAIKYEGVSYLLKTEDDEEIVNAVRGAVESIKSNLRNRALIDKAKHRESLVKYMVQREMLLDIINSGSISLDKDENYANGQVINLDTSKPVFLLFGRVRNVLAERGYLEQFETALALELLTGKCLSHAVKFNVANIDKNDILWVLQPKIFDGSGKITENNEAVWERSILFVSEMLETLQVACWESLDLEISFILYDQPVLWDAVGEILELMKVAAVRENYNKSGIPIMYSIDVWKEQTIDEQYKKPILSGYLQLKKINLLQTYLEQGMKEKFENLLSSIFGYLKEVPSIHYLPAIEIYTTISLMLMSYINRCQLAEKLTLQIELHKLLRIDKFNSWEDAADYMLELSEHIFELKVAEHEDNNYNMVRRIKSFIYKNFSDDLSLVRIAKHVNYNPSYVSRLFKQVTGGNLFDYISDAKIRKAKELLETTTDNIYNVAKAAGFGSSQYFATVFRKINGLTPQEYRELYCKTGKQNEQM